MTKSEEIAALLFEKIRKDEISGRLPAEQELAKQCGVSPVTAAKALNILRDQGVVKRISGRGTFVVKPEKKILRIMSNCYFAEKLFPLLTASFPDVEIENAGNMDEADAVVLPTTIPFFRESIFCPGRRRGSTGSRRKENFFRRFLSSTMCGEPFGDCRIFFLRISFFTTKNLCGS